MNRPSGKTGSFGLVFQSFNLFPQYSVHKNITLAAELWRRKSIRARS